MPDGLRVPYTAGADGMYYSPFERMARLQGAGHHA